MYVAAEHQVFLMSRQNTNCFLEHQFFCHHLKGLSVNIEKSNPHLQTAEKMLYTVRHYEYKQLQIISLREESRELYKNWKEIYIHTQCIHTHREIVVFTVTFLTIMRLYHIVTATNVISSNS